MVSFEGRFGIESYFLMSRCVALSPVYKLLLCMLLGWRIDYI